MKIYKTIIVDFDCLNCIITVDKRKLKSYLQSYYSHQNSTVNYIKRK